MTDAYTQSGPWRPEDGATSDSSSCANEPSQVGARFDVRSRPDGGTIVRLTIPTEPAVGGEESI